MSGAIRFGILSFAHYHANFWAEAINSSDDASLVGIWDDNEARGQDAARRYNTRFWSNLDELLSQCDAVGVTSETSRHVPLVQAAAAARVHVLLEKPMARNTAECARIVEAVRRSGITFIQNFPKRYDPVNHELVRRVHAGDLGTISLVRVRHCNYHLLELGKTAAENWFGDPEQSGGGALLDEGIHAADLLLWLLGAPERVTALTSSSTLGLPLDDTALAIFAYASGTLAEITSSGAQVAAENSIEVFGTEGSAILSGVDLASRDFAREPYLKFFRRGNPRGTWEGSEIIPYFKKGYFHQHAPLHFIQVLQGRAQPPLSLDDGWKSVAMIEAAYRASRTGTTQTIDYRLPTSEPA